MYPPVIPPPDFFDLEEEENNIKKEMFKKNNTGSPLYDETGKVKLPVDEKGILILDPESRTRIIDVHVEAYMLSVYSEWIRSATDVAEEQGWEQTVDWLHGLKRAVDKDFDTVDEDHRIIVNEERKKRGLSDYETHQRWWCSTVRGQGENRWDEEQQDDEQEDDETGDDIGSETENPTRSVAGPPDNDNIEQEAFSDDCRLAPQEHEELSPTGALNESLAESPTQSEDSPTPPSLDLVTLWW